MLIDSETTRTSDDLHGGIGTPLWKSGVKNKCFPVTGFNFVFHIGPVK
jgi:hypothetical protein